MVKRFLLALLLLGASVFLAAESNVTIDMELYNTVMRTRDSSSSQYWAYGIAGKGALSFKPTGNKNIRGDLAGDIIYPDSSGIPGFSLQKAFIKAKFPSFRLTIGKTRLGWGDGFVFNSGDVVFGSISPYVNLIGPEIRTETAWLTAVNFPLGRFSFIEVLVKAPDLNSLGIGKIQDSGAGFRLFTKAAGIKIETGYYFDGTDIASYNLQYTKSTESISIPSLHRPYVSLQGNLGVDWYVNSSIAIPSLRNSTLESVAKDTCNISFGLFHMLKIGYNSSLSFRFESVVLPYLNWTETDGTAGSYAILAYPEITLGLGQTLNVSVRSIVSPVDLSAQVTSGFSWNVFEGFDLVGYATINMGDGNDTFAWKKYSWDPQFDVVDGISLMAGVKYIY